MTEPQYRQVRNVAVWFIGADDGSTGYDVRLEQSDRSIHRLFRIEPGCDATAVGMMVGALDIAAASGARWLFDSSESDHSDQESR